MSQTELSGADAPGLYFSPWPGREPRAWQRDAFPVILDAIRRQESDPDHWPIVFAVMGSGKSSEIAEVVAWAVWLGWQVVVTTPTIALVDQLSATIRDRVSPANVFGGTRLVGRYYTHEKRLGGTAAGAGVTVTCHPSLADCVTALRLEGRTVGLWIADEAHRTESAQIRDHVDRMAPGARIGFSATPYRSNADATLRLWSTQVVQYSPDDAVRDGVLVPWVTHALPPQTQARVETLCAEGDTAAMDFAREIVDSACVDWLASGAAPGPGVVSASSIEDAEQFAAELSERGVRALAVHSRQSREIVKARVAALQRGDVTALVHVGLLVEGVDLPWLRWLCLRRRRARVGFVQEVGRVLRTAPGKREALIFDPWGQLAEYGLTHLAALGESGVADVEPDEDEIERRIDAGEWMEFVDPFTGRTYRIPVKGAKLKPDELSAISHATANSYLLECAAALRNAGLIQRQPFKAGSWRRRPATTKQCEALNYVSKAAHVMARAQSPYLKAFARAHKQITGTLGVGCPVSAGAVSDFLDVWFAIKVRGKTPDGQWDTSAQDQATQIWHRLGIDPSPVLADDPRAMLGGDTAAVNTSVNGSVP